MSIGGIAYTLLIAFPLYICTNRSCSFDIVRDSLVRNNAYFSRITSTASMAVPMHWFLIC